MAPNPFAPTPENKWAPSTLAVHADDHLNPSIDIAPAIHLSTTFEYSKDPSTLIPVADLGDAAPDSYVYSRVFAPSSTRLETVLTSLLGAKAITYSSGLAALFAAYTLLKPRRVAITGGYHGAHGVLDIHRRLTGLEVLPLDCEAEKLGPGDVIHVETPVNPTGEARNLAAYVEKARSRGALVLVDATFAPPPLQDPFALGADMVMHSGTKYLGGHSDLLCGVLATRNAEWAKQLFEDRIYLGNIMGSLEAWLGMRSVRTLQLRVETQSKGAENLVKWLAAALAGKMESNGVGITEMTAQWNTIVPQTVAAIHHASLQTSDLPWITKQMPGGFGAVFAVTARTELQARTLPSKLRLFHHATSLGGVESLCEWRAMSDDTVDRRLLRFSIGVERWEDLRDDLFEGLKAVALEEEKAKA